MSVFRWTTLKPEYFPCILLLASWLPMRGAMQAIAFVILPFLVVLGFVFKQISLSKRDTIFWGVFFAFYAVYATTYSDFSLWNPIVGLITYSGLLLFSVRSVGFGKTARVFVLCTAGLTFFEGILGVMQVVVAQGGNFIFEGPAIGDYAVGTTLVDTNSHMYGAKMFYQSLFLLYAWHYAGKQRYISRNQRLLVLGGLVFGTLGTMYASPLAFVLIYIMVISCCYLLVSVWQLLRRKPLLLREIGLLAIWIVGMVFVIQLTQPANSFLVGAATQTVTETGENGAVPVTRKLEVLQELVQKDLLASPLTTLLGYGLGRHSSRAAMILSGDYLLNQPDWLPITSSPQTAYLVETYWNDGAKAQYHGSHIAMPSSSIQAVLMEFGLLGSLALLIYVGSIFARVRQFAACSPDSFQTFWLARIPLFILGMGASSLFFFWAEYPPVVAFVALLIVIGFAEMGENRWSLIRGKQ